MSRLISVLVIALSSVAASSVSAQVAERQAEAKPDPVVLARMLAMKMPAKGKHVPQPTAAQRAPDPSTMVVVTLPNGERRLARAKKPEGPNESKHYR